MPSVKDHCVRLQDIGLLESTFETRIGSWLDYFEPLSLVADANDDESSDSSQLQTVSGQFGDVLLVKERKTGNKYALKIFKKPLKKDEKQRLVLLLKFSNLLPKNSWPKSLVRYVSLFRFSKVPLETLLMESIEGVSLKTLIDRRYVRVPMRQWKCWMKDILEALAFLHENGIMHRDVHPGNIMITKDGKRAVLIDLDLMCVPSTDEPCHTLCHGVASAKSTAPDIWCFTDALRASSEPQQWYLSDVWATANSFLSYAYGEDGALTRRLGYTRRGPADCKRIPGDKVAKEAAYVAQFVGKPLRPVFLSMLDADWTQRPTAKEATEMLGNCSHRDTFVAPSVSPQLNERRTYSSSANDGYAAENGDDVVYSEVGDDDSDQYYESDYFDEQGHAIQKTAGLDAYYFD